MVKNLNAQLVAFAVLGNVRCYGELHAPPGRIKLTELQAEPLLRSGRLSRDLSLAPAEEPETEETGSEGSVSEDAGSADTSSEDSGSGDTSPADAGSEGSGSEDADANSDQAKIQEFLSKVKAEGGKVPTVKEMKAATGVDFKGADRDAIWADLSGPESDTPKDKPPKG